MPGKDSVYCPGSVFFCSDTQIEIIIIIISLQQLLLSEELLIKSTAVESSCLSPALAHAESPVDQQLSRVGSCPLSSVCIVQTSLILQFIRLTMKLVSKGQRALVTPAAVHCLSPFTSITFHWLERLT